MISLDVDGVLLNYMGKIIDIINSKDKNIKLSLNQFTSWNYIVERFPNVEILFSKPEIYKTVEPIDGAEKFLEELIDNYGYKNIQIVTSSHGKILEAKNIKLKEVFGHIKDFCKIPINHVGLLEEGNYDKSKYTTNTILVDDAPHNIKDHLSNNDKDFGIIVDFDYMWTKGLENEVDSTRLFRANSYNDILNSIDNIQKKYFEHNLIEI